jgi:hypothetical protein
MLCTGFNDWLCGGSLVVFLGMLSAGQVAAEPPRDYGGRYPHLAVSNEQGECGIGAVVPWAGKLWFLTYAAHRPLGSDDGLYEVDAALAIARRPESVGGTPAARLIHRETSQLLIGPYLIDAGGAVHAVPPEAMEGRLSAAARHLTEPASKAYVYDMEGLLADGAGWESGAGWPKGPPSPRLALGASTEKETGSERSEVPVPFSNSRTRRNTGARGVGPCQSSRRCWRSEGRDAESEPASSERKAGCLKRASGEMARVRPELRWW